MISSLIERICNCSSFFRDLAEYDIWIWFHDKDEKNPKNDYEHFRFIFTIKMKLELNGIDPDSYVDTYLKLCKIYNRQINPEPLFNYYIDFMIYMKDKKKFKFL